MAILVHADQSEWREFCAGAGTAVLLPERLYDSYSGTNCAGGISSPAPQGIRLYINSDLRRVLI